MNIGLFFLLVGVNFLMALSGRIPANPHKNIILETTLPKDKLQDPQVLSISQAYKKRLLQWAGIFTVLSLPIIVIPYDSLTILYFIIALFSFIGTCFYLEVIYIRKMTTMKVKNNWLLPTSPILVDTTLVTNKNRKLVSIWWFLPSLLVTLGGVIYSFNLLGSTNGNWIFALLAVFIFGLFLLLYYFIARLPVKPLTSDTAINQKVNDLMRHHWSMLMVVSAFVMSPLALITGLSVTIPYEQMILISVLYAILLLGFVIFTFYYLFSSRKKQDQLIAQTAEYRYTDEDQYWKYSIYINPNDHRIMVPDRIGMNISINLGRPAGKITMIITGILILGTLIFSSVPMLLGDFSNNPFQLETTQKGITLSAPIAQKRTIAWKEVEAVKLVKTLPKDKIRVYGTATDNYLTGEFRVNNQPAYLLVHTKDQPILEIQTNEKIYYYTNKDHTLTQKYFDDIQKKIK